MSAREEESFTQVKSKRGGRRKIRSGSQELKTQDSWEMVPSSSFSDWKLEQNPISGFLTLMKNFVTNHTINHEQLMRGGGIAIIGKTTYVLRTRAKVHRNRPNLYCFRASDLELSVEQTFIFQNIREIA